MTIHCAAEIEQAEKAKLGSSKQTTLKKTVSITGIGLFTAERTVLTLHPAPSGTGLLFQRNDFYDKPYVAAKLENVVSTPRCTVLGNSSFTIHTVEHLLAALSGMGIDNAFLELSGPEVPILDGSAEPFVALIQDAGISIQDAPKDLHILQSPVSWSNDEVHLVALPAETFSISYTLHFPQSKVLGTQYLQATIEPEYFSKEIAQCRTFCLYEEIAPFIESGLIKGGGLDNAVIIKNDVVINPEHTRFPNEMVRHKILDLIGDLALIPEGFRAHIIAIRSGHASNIAFAQKLYNQIKMEKA